MVKFSGNFNKYGITLRLVELEDADFILRLRTDNNLNKYLSATSSNLFDQINWLKNYKKRENLGEEYYFLALDDCDRKLGTIRLYNFTESAFEVGSWLFRSNSPFGIAIKTEIIAKEIGFEELGYESCLFSVRNNNQSVLNYHRRFMPQLIKESDIDSFFKLNRQDFLIAKERILKFL